MPKVFASCKALIMKDGKFLLMKEKIGNIFVWDLPGGKIDHGETPHQALKREIKEELCLDISIDKYAGLWWFFCEGSNNQVICNTFFCTPTNFEIDTTKNPADENFVEYKWLTKDEFIKGNFNVNPSLIELISDLNI